MGEMADYTLEEVEDEEEARLDYHLGLMNDQEAYDGEEMADLTPIVGCSGCEGTAGRLGCPEHSPNVYVGEQVRPFAHLVLRCPWCGKDMQMDCFKMEMIESHKL